MKFQPKRLMAAFACVILAAATSTAQAEIGDIKVASGPSIGYLPYYVMEHHKLFEKHAKAAGLGDVKASYVAITGGAAMTTGTAAASRASAARSSAKASRV